MYVPNNCVTYEVMIIKTRIVKYFLKYQNKTETNSWQKNQTLKSFEFQTEQNNNNNNNNSFSRGYVMTLNVMTPKI